MKLTVNGVERSLETPPLTPLLHVLREELGITSPKAGCQQGGCGSCTILVDGAPRRACLLPVAALDGAEITTLEGLAKNGTLHPLQQAWIDEQVPQCGYCQNGQIMTAKALLDRNPNPTDAEIREGMEGALCRCMTYYRIQAAIKRVVRGTSASAEEAGV